MIIGSCFGLGTEVSSTLAAFFTIDAGDVDSSVVLPNLVNTFLFAGAGTLVSNVDGCGWGTGAAAGSSAP